MRAAVFLLLIATSLEARYAGRDLVLPVVGRSEGVGGRVFDTTIRIVNVSSEPADVTLSYLVASQPNPSPRRDRLQVAAGGSAMFTGLPGGFGAMRIHSTRDITGAALLSSRVSGSDASPKVAALQAIPAGSAFGLADTITLAAFGGEDQRARLYVVETTGQPLLFRMSLLDAGGNVVAEKLRYVAAGEAWSYDLHTEFSMERRLRAGPSAGFQPARRRQDAGGPAGKMPALHPRLRLHGVNGDGRVIAVTGHYAVASGVTTFHEMTFPTTPRHRLSYLELATYAGAAVFLVLASRRR